MKIKVLSLDGKSKNDIDISDKIFSLKAKKTPDKKKK